MARVLPLAEVLNNQGVAVSRQGHDGTGLFVQAAAADPNAADYHFNLAVSLKRHGTDAARSERIDSMPETAAKRCGSAATAAAWKAPKISTDSGRCRRSRWSGLCARFDAAHFRQAALMMDQMEASRLAALSPHERAVKLSGQAKDYLESRAAA